MILYIGHQVVITMSDGSAIRGKLRWPTVRGCLRISGAEDLDRAGQQIPGMVIIPRSRVVIAQVL